MYTLDSNVQKKLQLTINLTLYQWTFYSLDPWPTWPVKLVGSAYIPHSPIFEPGSGYNGMIPGDCSTFLGTMEVKHTN